MELNASPDVHESTHVHWAQTRRAYWRDVREQVWASLPASGRPAAPGNTATQPWPRPVWTGEAYIGDDPSGSSIVAYKVRFHYEDNTVLDIATPWMVWDGGNIWWYESIEALHAPVRGYLEPYLTLYPTFLRLDKQARTPEVKA